MLPTRTRRGKTIVVATAVLLTLVALGPSSSSVTAAPAAPPSNTAEPTIEGRPDQGRRLTGSTGTWTGTAPLRFSYAWVRCGTDGGRPDGGNCTVVSGATDRRYTLRAADVGFRMRIRVTATNAEGSSTVASNPTGVVQGQWQVGSRLKLEAIDRAEPLNAGDVVFTAGLTAQIDAELPRAAIVKGIPIGTIETIEVDGHQQRADVRPFVDPDRASYVWVLLSQDE